MNTTANLTTNFYAGIMNMQFKIFFLIFHIFISFVGPSLLYSIRWYERYSCQQTYRTLINQMLSHTCLIIIARCFIGRLPYLVILFMGPFSITTCSRFIFVARYFFLIIYVEILMWQALKFFYIFQWRHMVALNDSFVATFVTTCNLFFSGLFTFTTYMMEFQNSELEYHICTGHHPHVNILQSSFIMSWLHNASNPELSLEDVSKHDPLAMLTRIIFFLLVLVTFNIWVYSRKELLIRVGNQVLGRNSPTFMPNHDNPSTIEVGTLQKFEQFKKTKNALIGASGSLVVIVLILLLLLPSVISKSFAKNNVEGITHGTGQIWTLVSRITLPILSYCVLPMVVIAGNSKMREILLRQIKEKFFKWC